MFGIGGCEEVWSSIFWAQRLGKREHQMKGCVAEQKVRVCQMNAWTLRLPCSFFLIASISDEGRPILLVSLDFSAALDMVDHATLLKRLSCSFGVSGVVHSWIESYLCGRTQSVRMGSHSSAVTPCTVGVPQGSVLGPLLCLHFSTVHHCSIPSGPSTAVRRRYATLCRSVTPKL